MLIFRILSSNNLYLSSDVDGVSFDMYSPKINYGEQNVTLTFKVKFKGHSLNVYLANYILVAWS